VNIELEADDLRAALRQQADPERAAGEKAYLKSQLKFYGVRVPEKRKIAQAWIRAHRDTPIDEVAALAAHLWESEWHEERSLAVMLLQYRSSDLSADHLPLIERMMAEANTWAHLDEIAVRLAGALIDNDPSTLDRLPVWAESGNFWVRRAAVLAQLPQFRREEGDLDLFSRIVTPMFAEGADWSKDERFFIRKGIGWALREIGKQRPEWVADFAAAHRSAMSGLTFREATRNLPPEIAARLES
jgi:3-methyladenine DNA glycosylase AlkD